MTTQRNQPRSLLGIALTALLLCSTASAQTQRTRQASLQNFQVAQAGGGSIPRVCLQVYNAPIEGCTDDEFISAECSSACIRGVLDIQQDIQDACANVDANPRTLLGQALLGQLVRVLCTELGASIPPAAGPSSPAGTRTLTVPTATPTVGNGGGDSTTLIFQPSPTTKPQAPVDTDSAAPPLVPAPSPGTPGDDEDEDEDEDERPNGAGGSPFDIVAFADAGRTTPLLVQVGAVAAGVAVVLLR